MSSYRWVARAGVQDGMTERRVDGSALQLVTVCLCDDGAGEISTSSASRFCRPAVLTHLRRSEARELAFCLLELAERAGRRSRDGR